MTAAALDWDDIQGNVLRGYGFDHARYLLLSVGDRDAARRWLSQVLAEVTPATPWATRPATTLNLAFTHRGLAALGVDDAALGSFPADFRQGMRGRATEQLGDVGVDSPETWEPAGVHHPAVHLLVMVHAAAGDGGDARAFLLANDAADHGFALVGSERLGALPASASEDGEPPADRRPLASRPGPTAQGGESPSWRSPRPLQVEHFGFADGISQPAVEGAQEPTTVGGNGTPLAAGRWRPVRAGEFVLGYPDEEEEAGPLPLPEVLTRNGSYLVYRKLAQDVAAFRRVTADLAERHDVAAEVLAAKLVGRHADGSPLVPDAGSAAAAGAVAAAAGASALNDFRYAGDRRGAACPVGSHIRRVNPRDAFGMKPELVSRHRLLRRGMPYGPPLAADATEDDGVERGLVFMAYCASISRQFEFVQRAWMNDGNVFGAGYTPDPIAGHDAAPRGFVFEVPGRGPVFLDGLPRLVRPRGGDYLFQPGLRGLRYLADL